MGKKLQVASDKSELIGQIPLACADERAAVEFMEAQRWGGKAKCPRCESENVYQMMGKNGQRQANFRWRCKECSLQFTVKRGTVLEDSPIPLRHWCYAFWRASTSKKGVSALEIRRHTGLSYKSALFLMHRIRFAMVEDESEQLKGPVEFDDSWVGGKPRHKHFSSKTTKSIKTPVLALVERDGKKRVRTRPIPKVSFKNLKEYIHQQIDVNAKVFTDEALRFRGIASHFKGGHGVVHHGIYEYVRRDPKGGPDASTNTVESFFALMKRSIHGIYHSVSPEHLHRYLSERQFTYNHRGMEDGERTVAAIKGAAGKRLTYKESIGA